MAVTSAASAGSGPVPVRLTAASAVLAMQPEDADRHVPVHLDAVVTYVDAAWQMCFVADASAGIFVKIPGGPQVQVGQRVAVDGVSAAGDFAPVVVADHIEPRGTAPLPEPRRLPIPLIMGGRADSQWVEIAGSVRNVSADAVHANLDIVAEGRRFQASLPLPQNLSALSALTGAEVRVRGVCGTIFNRRRQMIGVQFFVPRPTDIVVVTPPPADVFDAPSRDVDHLLGYASATSPSGRVRIRAVVTQVLPNGEVFAADHTGGLRVRPLWPMPLVRGEEFDAAGFPERDGFAVSLDDATIRPTGARRAVTPEPLDVVQAAAGANASSLVTIDATLIDVARRADAAVLVLAAHGRVFNAELPAGSAGSKTWTPGSRLRVTGICIVMTDEHLHPQRFRLALGAADDVTVLAEGPFWTGGRLLSALAVLASVALVIGIWVIALRRRVRAQTLVIGERLAHEARLERRYADLFENANDVVMTLDLDLRVTAINRAGERLLGLTRDQMLGRQVSDLIVPEHKMRGLEAFRRKLEGHEDATTYDVDLFHADGRRISFEVSSRLHRLDGVPQSVDVIARDVTERRQVAVELESARDAAEAASRAKSQFLANMSHEIRTPLNGVMGMTALVLETDLTAEQREFLELSRTSAESLLTLINDILDLSKVEAGKLELDSIGFRLRDCLGEAMKLLALRAGAKGLEIGYRVRPDVPDRLVGDPGRLRQVIINLVGNAVKFTSEGEVALEVNVEAEEDDSVVLHVSVRDTGVGIPRDKQQAIFEPFAQADGSITRKFGGTGLGLTICQLLVEKMGGRIWVESEPGHGATFHFTARLGLQHAHTAPVPVGPEKLHGVEALVVDDNAASRRNLRELLASWGMQAGVAASGADALVLLEQAEAAGWSPRLVLIDAGMPGMDGFALAARIRQRPQWSGMRLVLLTAAGQRGDALRCHELGISAYLTKPATHSELLETVHTVLGLAATAAEPAPLVTRHFLNESRRTLRILLAEDHPINQKLAVRMLERCGHRVDVAENGNAALLWLETNRCDLILMDLQMPELDGLEATRIIRAREQGTGRRVPIIAMTAHALRGDEERCREAGMDGYVSKPIEIARLDAEIARVLGREPSRPPGERHRSSDADKPSSDGGSASSS